MYQENLIPLAEPSMLPWLAFGVSIVTAVVAIVTAGGVILNVYFSRKTARQQATLEFLEKYKSDMMGHSARIVDLEVQEHEKSITGAVKRERAEFRNFILNRFELLAVGLNHKIYDEQMIFDTLSLDIINLYEFNKYFIAEARERAASKSKHSEDIFINFEGLVRKFRARLAKK